MSGLQLFNISSNAILTTADTDGHYLLKPHVSLLHFTLFTHPVCKRFLIYRMTELVFNFISFSLSSSVPPASFPVVPCLSKWSEKRESLCHISDINSMLKIHPRAHAYVTVRLFSLKYVQGFSHALHACLTQVCLEIDKPQRKPSWNIRERVQTRLQVTTLMLLMWITHLHLLKTIHSHLVIYTKRINKRAITCKCYYKPRFFQYTMLQVFSCNFFVDLSNFWMKIVST